MMALPPCFFMRVVHAAWTGIANDIAQGAQQLHYSAGAALPCQSKGRLNEPQ